MKMWKDPAIIELSFDETAVVGAENALSGANSQLDLGTCSNQYWAGNGKTLEEALEENPYWGGSWGSN